MKIKTILSNLIFKWRIWKWCREADRIKQKYERRLRNAKQIHRHGVYSSAMPELPEGKDA